MEFMVNLQNGLDELKPSLFGMPRPCYTLGRLDTLAVVQPSILPAHGMANLGIQNCSQSNSSPRFFLLHSATSLPSRRTAIHDISSAS